jgi:hypothetical protein
MRPSPEEWATLTSVVLSPSRNVKSIRQFFRVHHTQLQKISDLLPLQASNEELDYIATTLKRRSDGGIMLKGPVK